MVDLARGSHPTARLLDLVPGRSGKAYRDWLDERGDAGRERLSPRQQTRLASALAAHPDHVAVEVAYHCAQDLRDVFHQPTPARGRQLAEQLIATLPSCPIPETARLDKTLRRWRTAFLAYFDTDGASNGGTQAINGIIELGRRIARGFRNVEHYRLRMLLITRGLDASPHTQL